MRYPRLEPAGPSVKVSAAIGPTEAELLLRAASASGMTRSQFIRRLISEELARRDAASVPSGG